jgi:hypothetical protein
MGKRVRLGLLLLSVACSACGSGGGAGDGGAAGTTGASGTTGTAGTTGGAGTTGNTPVGQCKQVVTTLCNRDNACNNAGAGTAAEIMACVNANNVAFGCDRATVSFADCLADVNVISCASLFPASGLGLPVSCNDAVDSIPLSVAQMKCSDLASAVCQRSARCQGVVPTPTQLQACQQDAFSQLDCLFAIDVSATYNQCLTDLPASSCPGADGGAPSIPSCTDVIVYIQ